MMSNESPFYKKHTMLRPERINSANKILQGPLDGQPDFIHFYTINGEKVAFLGNAPLAAEDLHNKFIRTNKMVLPEGARMVNPTKLKKLIKKSKKGLPYDMSDDNLFWGEALEDTILLNVCGEVKVSDFKALHFHNCKNHKSGASDYRTNLPPNLGGTCPRGVYTTSSTNDDELTDKSVLKKDLVIFYISIEEIDKIDKRIVAEYNSDHFPKANCNVKPIQDILKHYFELPYLKRYFGEKNYNYTPRYKWDKLKGIFLIPTLFTDQRVVYHCVPNVALRSSRKNRKEHEEYKKNSLSYWLEEVSKLTSEKKEAAIQGNDEDFIYIEEWSIFICKNAVLEVLKEKDLYLDTVLGTKI